jgi:glycerol-3-phosphate dehydrogenase (NAD(P)+)
VRAGLRTALLCRTAAQADELGHARLNERYLPGVELPRELRVRALEGGHDQLARGDLVFLAVPSKTVPEALAQLSGLGVSPRAGIVSLAKGLVPPDGLTPTVALEAVFGSQRVACVGGPSHAREMVETGAGLVCASRSEGLAHGVADAFQRAGVVCEVSDDPVGVELAGVAKNVAAVAVGATQAQGLNAAGMAAADIFLEVLALASASGGHARTFVGRAGTGDLVATALAPTSRNRSAGELLAAGGRGARDRAPARPRPGAPGPRRTGDHGARAPDRGLDAARRLGRAGTREAAATGALRAPVDLVGEAQGMVAAPLDSEGR